MELFENTPAPNAPQPLLNVTTLAQLYDVIEAFEGCDLRTSSTRTVIYDGNPAAKIMLIGEVPGAEEDKQGKPFVGRSGQLLNQMLGAIGLDREHVYITNTVFWRPPENRTPTPAEVASCRPLLDRHIALINPALILLVGGTAAKAVLQTDVGITKLRLNWHNLGNPYIDPVPCLPTFHPAYLLRNPPAKRDAWEDLKLFRDRARELGVLPEKETSHAA